MRFIKTQTQLIEEIHNAFDSAQDKLLREANEIISKVKTDPIQPIELISDRLKAVGFIQTPVNKEAEKLNDERMEIIKTTQEAELEANLIEYYKKTYPFLKFLTEVELKKICDKYKLIFAPVSAYKENVPEKNLRDIENAQKLRDEDKPIQMKFFSGRVWCTSDYTDLKVILEKKCSNLKNIPFKEISKEKYNGWLTEETRIAHGVLKALNIEIDYKPYVWIDGKVDEVNKDGLFIAAPESHFNLKGLTKKNKHGFFNMFTTEIKDPIVFRYVRGGIQVITKWGLEANDPALVVPVLN